MGLQGIIFDLDGVLCFTDNYHYLAWKVIADEKGLPFDRTLNDRLRGVSRMDSLAIILDSAGVRYPQEEMVSLANRKNKLYQQYLQNLGKEDVEPFAEVVLSSLKEKGYRLAVGSSSQNAPMILRKSGLLSYFDTVVDGTMLTRSKPDPQVFLLAAEALELSPWECLVIEDSEAGILAAKGGGFFTAGMGAAAKCEGLNLVLSSLGDIIPGISDL